MKVKFQGAIHCASLLASLLFTSCQKDVATVSEEKQEVAGSFERGVNPGGNVLIQYSGLQQATMFELQQARAATARYLNFNNAIADGYFDIGVVVEEMGHHFLDTSILDNTFDYRRPEILVYNMLEDSTMQLVAVEYAIPIPGNPNAPAGFTGSADVWDFNTGFDLWLLHAWVWAYNPLGVFNPTNPTVHVHH